MLGFDSEYLDFIEEASDRWSYFQRKGALTMFEQEVDYRLAKWLLQLVLLKMALRRSNSNTKASKAAIGWLP